MDIPRTPDGQQSELAKLRSLLQELRNTRCARKPLPGHDTIPKLQKCKGETLSDRYALGIDCDEVYPGILIGDEGTARNLEYLQGIGVTHVLNCAEGKSFGQVETSAAMYKPVKIQYKGLNISDLPQFPISRHFEECTEFVENGLSNGGRVLVHCLMGMSRSATIVLAYLMRYKKMCALEALKSVLEHRDIRPNDGFLKQLCDYEMKLRGISPPSPTQEPPSVPSR